MYGLDWREVFKHEFISKEEGEEESIPLEYTIPEFTPHYSYMHYSQPNNKNKLILPCDPADIRYTSFRRFPFIYLVFPNIEVAK